MGQYSQWLYHREIDQQLRERLELLAQELHSLQEQAAQLKNAVSDPDNPILQAIAMQQSVKALLEQKANGSSTQELPILPRDTKKQSAKSISPALFAWSNLPNLDTQKMQMADADADTQKTEAIQQLSSPYPEVNLLPTDMAAFIDTHEQTLPQMQVPTWLRKVALTRNISGRAKSGSDERTDASIQRWLERWGKQLPNTPLPQKQQKLQTSSEQ